MYDTLKLDAGVDLSHFPDAVDVSSLQWQTKDIGRPTGATYRLTEDGRLLRREVTHREKTPDEKQAEAEDHGFTSWEEYVTAHDEMSAEEKLDAGLALTYSEQTVDDTWWANHNQHGSFEFHASGSRHEGLPDFVLSYEARFYRGELDEIVFLGDRHNDYDFEAAVDALAACEPE